MFSYKLFYHCSHGYAFYAASYLKGDLKTFFDLIEDVIAQADEIDEKFLQVSIAKVIVYENCHPLVVT